MIKLTRESALAAAGAKSLRAWASSGRVPAVWACDVKSGALLLKAIPNETPASESMAPVTVSEVSGAQELASALDIDEGRLWSWCSALAAVLAAGKIAHGGTPEGVAPLLALAG